MEMNLEQDQSRDLPMLIRRGLTGPASRRFFEPVVASNCSSRLLIFTLKGIVAFSIMYLLFYALPLYYLDSDVYVLSFDATQFCLHLVFGTVMLLIAATPLVFYISTEGREDSARRHEWSEEAVQRSLSDLFYHIFSGLPRLIYATFENTFWWRWSRDRATTQSLLRFVMSYALGIFAWCCLLGIYLLPWVLIGMKWLDMVEEVDKSTVELARVWSGERPSLHFQEDLIRAVVWLYFELWCSNSATHMVATIKMKNRCPDEVPPLTERGTVGQGIQCKFICAMASVPVVMYGSYIIEAIVTVPDDNLLSKRVLTVFYGVPLLLIPLYSILVAKIYIPLILMLRDNLNIYRVKLREILTFTGPETDVEVKLYELGRNVADAMSEWSGILAIHLIMGALEIVIFVAMQWRLIVSHGTLHEIWYSTWGFPLVYMSTIAWLGQVWVIAQYNADVLGVAAEVRVWRTEVAIRVEGVTFRLMGRAIATGDFRSLALTAISTVMSGAVKQFSDSLHG